MRETLANGATKVNTLDFNIIGAVADQAFLDIALVSKVKLYCIYKGKGV